MEKSYIKLLCRHIEKRYGHSIETTDDFSGLSDDIYSAVKERLSVSTLKRCFGRVNAHLTHRNTTLNILSKYIGLSDWAEFQRNIRTNLGGESDFKSIKAIDIDRMIPGCRLCIKWLPDREIRVRYLGHNRFLILKAVNTKLKVSDIIEIALLAQGEPMFISQVARGDEAYSGYIAGQLHGVSIEMDQD